MAKVMPVKWNVVTEDSIIGDNVLFQQQCSSNQCQGQCRKADNKKRRPADRQNGVDRSNRTINE